MHHHKCLRFSLAANFVCLFLFVWLFSGFGQTVPVTNWRVGDDAIVRKTFNDKPTNFTSQKSGRFVVKIENPDRKKVKSRKRAGIIINKKIVFFQRAQQTQFLKN